MTAMNRYVASADIVIVRRAIARCSRPLMSRLLPGEVVVEVELVSGIAIRHLRHHASLQLAGHSGDAIRSGSAAPITTWYSGALNWAKSRTFA
jgi:hypothetical protein